MVPPTPLSPRGARKPVVLAVDDHPVARAVLEAVLRSEGCEVRLASGGPEAVAVYRREHAAIDLVLLAVRMRGLDGPATLEALRQIDPAVRCCFMTVATTGDDQEARRLLGLGVEAVIPKPYRLEVIRNLISQL